MKRIPSELGHLTPRPRLSPEAHKRDAGRVLLLVGSELMPGAAILALGGALRAGAGLATLGLQGRGLLGCVPAAVPEAIYVDLSAAPESLEAIAADARLAGCGLGNTSLTRALIERLLALEGGAPLVLDADALNVFAGEPERLAARSGSTVHRSRAAAELAL